MDIGNAMHQQFLKDFIHSLQADSEDGNSRIQSRSMSESSLNPNAAEFVPSYLKSSDGDDEDEEPPNDPKVLAISTTTLMNDETVHDASSATRDAKQNRIQRQLFNLMNLLVNQNLPLSDIIFSLATNGQGINVQFMTPENGKRQPLDKHLCIAAGLHLKVGDGELTSTRPGHALAAQFLSRMGNVLADKSKDQKPSICPKCTSLQRKNSYTDLEIDRQIEDIKAFERLINEDAGVRYQEAFKELCIKLGLTANGGHSAGLESTPAALTKLGEIITDDDDAEVPFVEDEQSNYDWDSFSPGFTAMKVTNRYATPNETENEMQMDEKPEHQRHPLHKEQKKLSPDVPSTTPAMPASPANGSSGYSKLYKLNWSNLTALRKTNNNHNEKESKILRWRGGSSAMAAASAAARTTGGTTATAAASGRTASTTGTATGISNRTATKKLPEQIHPNNSRNVRASQRALQNKSGIVSQNIAEVANQTQLKPSSNYKLDTRKQLDLAKQHLNQVPVSKITKAATLGRTSGSEQSQGVKGSSSTLRVVAPRSTHASQMRQSEVKRRLRLLRGDVDTDVQFNEYLFK